MTHSAEHLATSGNIDEQTNKCNESPRAVLAAQLVEFITTTAYRTQDYIALFSEENPLFYSRPEQKAQFFGEVSLSVLAINDTLGFLGGVVVEVEDEASNIQFLGRITGCLGYDPSEDTWELSIDRPDLLIGINTVTLSDALIEGVEKM